MLRLQGRVGNHAVGRLLRQPSIVKDPPSRQQITAQDVGGIIHDHVDVWYQNSRLGILTADTQDNEDAEKWFLLSLLGNLLWASTSLLAAELVLPIRAMSFAGATIGTGTLQQFFDTKQAAELKPMIVQELSRRAGQMETSIELKQRIEVAFVKHGLTNADDNAQTQKRYELAWALMFGDNVPYNGRAELEARARDTVEKISTEFSKIYKQVKALVQSSSIPGSPANVDSEGNLISGSEYVDKQYEDLGGSIGNLKDKERYRKNWPYYVSGIYHLALIRSGVAHEMLPDVKTRSLSPSYTEYAFSDGTTVILELNSKKGLYTLDRTFRKIQLDPLAGSTIYVPTPDRGAVRLGDLGR